MFQNIDLFIAGVQLDLEQALQQAAPVDKGRLRNSIKVKINKNGSLSIHMVKYGPMLDRGTGLYGPLGAAYEIKPKTKKALKWSRNGQGPRGGKIKESVFAKKVMHPGIRPTAWIRNVFYHVLPTIIKRNTKRYLGPGVELEVTFNDNNN